MAVDLRALRSFVAIAAAGSITRAAEHVHMAQPALSILLRQLEEQLGAVLFERTYRGVKLTMAGERFLSHAREIIKRVDVAVEDVREAVAEPTGRVALGLPQSVAKFLAVPLVRETVRCWPKVRLQVIEMNSGYVIDHLIKGNIDLGITFGTEENSSVSYSHLLDEELVFISSRQQIDAFLRKKKRRTNTIAAAELHDFPIILPTTAHSLRRRIDEYLYQQDIRLNVIAEVDAIPQLLALAAEGIGSTIHSYASAFGYQSLDTLSMLKITKPPITRSVYLCRSSTTPQSIATSVTHDFLKQYASRLVQTNQWPTTVSSN